jgi:hypothetical protein
LSDISTEIATHTGKDRRRSARPERLWIGGVEFVRNDVVAQEQGNITERTVNRGDKDGAPYIYLGGVKYRPIARYHEFLLAQVQVRNRPRNKRRTVGRPSQKNLLSNSASARRRST